MSHFKFYSALLHLKIISLKKPLQIGLCNKALRKHKPNKPRLITNILIILISSDLRYLFNFSFK